MLNQKRSIRFMLFTLMAAVMGAGVCAPAMGIVSSNFIAQQKIQPKNPMGSPEGKKETVKALIGGAISGVIKSAFCIYLNNKLIIPNKSGTFPIVFALTTALEMFILKKTLNIAGGVTIRALLASSFVTAIMINPQPTQGASTLANVMFGPINGILSWILSGGTATPAVTITAGVKK